MHINDFLHARPYPANHREALVQDIAGVTAAHVDGVVALGEPVHGAAERIGYEPGQGVAVETRQGDIWIGVLAVIEPGTDEKQVKKEINGRVQAALWNLLEIQAVSIQTELVYQDGVPPVLARENRESLPLS